MWPCDQCQQCSDHSLVDITALGPWSWSLREYQDPLVSVISLFPRCVGGRVGGYSDRYTAWPIPCGEASGRLGTWQLSRALM